MFAGIDTARDWPDHGMTTDRWAAIRPRTVFLHDLTATQDGVYLAPLIGPAAPSHCGDEFPHVRLWRGRAYLEDGHHRAVRAALAGRRVLTARILEVRP